MRKRLHLLKEVPRLPREIRYLLRGICSHLQISGYVTLLIVIERFRKSLKLFDPLNVLARKWRIDLLIRQQWVKDKKLDKIVANLYLQNSMSNIFENQASNFFLNTTCFTPIFCFTVPPSRLRLTSSKEFPIVDGTLVSFNCTSERVYPNPIFEWYKNDKLIQRFVLFFLF